MATPDWWTHGVGGYANARSAYFHPDGYKAESLDRWEVREHLVIPSGTTQCEAVLLDRGTTITNVGFHTGNTLAVTPTSWGYQVWTHEVPAHLNDLAFAASRNATTTITRTSGTFTETQIGRLITGTGITGGTYVTAQTTTTVTISAAASGSGSMTATLGQYMGPWYPLGATADQTTTVPTINAAALKALTTPFIPPGRGLYFFSFLMVAGTVCTLIGAAPSTNVASSFFSTTPALACNKAAQTFPTTTQMATSMAGMVVNRSQPYCWAT